MKLTQVNDTTIRITLSMEDLAEHGMELMDFLTPQEKTEDFFYTVMQELELPEGFGETGMLSFRVTPKPDRIEVYVTQADLDPELEDMEDFTDLTKALTDPDQVTPEEALTMLEDLLKNTGATEEDLEELDRLRGEVASLKEREVAQEEHQQMPEFVHYVLAFRDVASAVLFAKAIQLPIEASELYKLDKTHYYMTVLVNAIGKDRDYTNQAHALLLEYAKDAEHTRAYLQEHATLLLREGAVEFLTRLKVA